MKPGETADDVYAFIFKLPQAVTEMTGSDVIKLLAGAASVGRVTYIDSGSYFVILGNSVRINADELDNPGDVEIIRYSSLPTAGKAITLLTVRSGENMADDIEIKKRIIRTGRTGIHNDLYYVLNIDLEIMAVTDGPSGPVCEWVSGKYRSHATGFQVKLDAIEAEHYFNPRLAYTTTIVRWEY